MIKMVMLIWISITLIMETVKLTHMFLMSTASISIKMEICIEMTNPKEDLRNDNR